MKRSERISRAARHELARGAMFSTAGMAAGVWAVVAYQSGNVLGGTGLIAGAAIALGLGCLHGREWLRLRRMVRVEAHWETLRAIRPRL